MTHEIERFTFDISFFVVFMWTLLVLVAVCVDFVCLWVFAVL
jgi:hypothetical protein